MNPLKSLSVQGNIHFVALSLIILLLVLQNIYFIVFILFFVKIKPKYILLAVCVFFLSFREVKAPSTCTIIDIDEYSTCKSETNIRIKGDYQIGDIVKLEGTFYPPSGRTSPFTFDYEKYLLGKNIHYTFQDQGSYVIGHRFSIYAIRDQIKQYIKTFDELPRKYLSALILGDKQYFSKHDLNRFSEMGISHMFAISGLHVGFLALMLEKFIKKKYVLCFIFFYMVIAGFTPSIVRAGSMYILYYFLREKGYTSLDCLSIVFIGSIVANRFIIYDVGFQLSFLVTFFLVTMSPKNLLHVSIVAQYATLPIIVNMYNQVNLITIFINVYLVWLMSNVVLPLGFTTLLLKIEDIYSEVIVLFERIVFISSEFNMIITIPNLHPFVIALYYFFIRKKVVVLLLLIPLFLEPSKGVYFIDVDQGDSTLIVDEYVYLIDTGGRHGRDITKRNVVPVLRSLGIEEIDYLILTHNHYDHIAGYQDILDAFNVNTVVISEYAEFSIKFDGRLVKAKVGESFGVITVLGPEREQSNINNQSIQLKVQLKDSFYFMGDSELKESFGQMDYVKLGHHGSKTSTTDMMLSKTNPKALIISLGRNNYGLPSKEVLEMIEGYVVYRTDIDGTVIYIDGRLYTTSEYEEYFLGFR